MKVGAIVWAWLDALASALLVWREGRRARQGLLIASEDASWVVRPMGQGGESLPSAVAKGTLVPPELMRHARKGLVTFELKEIVVRRIQVPAQAREFLSGIVRNQIERLSPWQASETVYGFDATPNGDDTATLNVRILMTSRGVIGAARDQVGAIGLRVDRIVAHEPRGGVPVTLWSQSSHAQPNLQRARWAVGLAVGVTIVLSLGVSGWALRSAAALEEQRDAVRMRQRQVQAAFTPQALRSLPPAQRVWALKRTVPAAVLVLEALSRALPDQAHLTEFALDNGSVRLSGLAGDAPALLSPLERSGFFTDVHFFAPTTRYADGVRFVFHIQAQVAPHLDLAGD